MANLPTTNDVDDWLEAYKKMQEQIEYLDERPLPMTKDGYDACVKAINSKKSINYSNWPLEAYF